MAHLVPMVNLLAQDGSFSSYGQLLAQDGSFSSYDQLLAQDGSFSSYGQLAQDGSFSSYGQLLAQDGSFRIHYRNLQRLAIEIYKFNNNLGPEILNDIFVANSSNYFNGIKFRGD